MVDTGTGDVPTAGTADRVIIRRVVERPMEPHPEGAFNRENRHPNQSRRDHPNQGDGGGCPQ